MNKKEEKQKKAKSKVLHTLSGDMLGVLQENQDGLVKKIIHEQETREERRKNYSAGSKKNQLYMFLSFVFLVGAFVAVFLVLTRDQLGSVEVAPRWQPRIFTDSSVLVEADGLKKDDISNAVYQEVVTSPIPRGEVEGIYLVEENNLMNFPRLVEATKASVPDNRIDIFGRNFMMGSFTNTNKSLFILLDVRSFQDAFPVMRFWEEKMFLDLHGFFGYKISASTEELLTKDFEDQVVQNKNARVLYDAQGNIVMMYVFVDEGSVVIASKEEAVKEVIARLAASQVRK